MSEDESAVERKPTHTEATKETAQANSGPNEPPGVPSTEIASRWKRWYLLGVASVGLAVGFFAGNSNSPVVSALLPLLFALIAGGGGLYLLQQDMASSEAVERIRVLGIALVLFCGCCLLAGVIGVATRTDIALKRLLPHWNDRSENSEILETNNAEEQLRLLMLRRKLTALGANETEQDAIVAGFRFDVSAVDSRKLRQDLDQAVADCKTASLDVAKNNVKIKVANVSYPEAPAQPAGSLDIYKDFLDAGCARLQAWSGSPRSLADPAFRRDITGIIEYMPASAVDPRTGPPYGIPPVLVSELGSVGIQTTWQKLRLSLLQLDGEFGNAIWEPGGPMDQWIDATINLTRSASTSTDDNDESSNESRRSFKAHPTKKKH